MTPVSGHKLSQTFLPVVAVMVYKSNEDYHLESHSIDKEGRVLEGRPLEQQTLDAMAETFFRDKRERVNLTGIVPECLLASNMTLGKNRLTWFRPAMKQPLFFSEGLKTKDGAAWVPPLIFSAVDKDLFVYALKKKERPGEKTLLFAAPFPNVYADGRVCLGDAKVKLPERMTYESAIAYWETLFWKSKFTGLHGERATKTDTMKLWRRLIASKGRIRFPISELKPHKQPIKKLFGL